MNTLAMRLLHVLASMLVLATAGCATTKNPAVPLADVDLERMYGGWYIVAKEHRYVVRIDVLPDTRNADWRVRPIWPVQLPFQIVYVDPQYRYVLFG